MGEPGKGATMLGMLFEKQKGNQCLLKATKMACQDGQVLNEEDIRGTCTKSLGYLHEKRDHTSAHLFLRPWLMSMVNPSAASGVGLMN
jgi:hypothetical protein